MSKLYTSKAREEPKWKHAFQTLSSELDAGLFKPGEPFYPMRAVCERFGFSIITARHVYNELRAHNRIFTRNRHRSFVCAPSRSKSMSVLPTAPKLVYLCFQAYCGRFDATEPSDLAPHNYHKMLHGFNRPPFDRLFHVRPISIEFCLENHKAFHNTDVILNQEVMFTSGDNPQIDREKMKVIREYLNPIVFQAMEPQADMTEVRLDKKNGMKEIVCCLLQSGRKNIGYLGGDPAKIWFASRFQGYLEALKVHGAPFKPEWIGITEGNSPDQVLPAITRIMSSNPPPSAIACSNDGRALAVLAWCRKSGVHVPGDLAVTGFDNIPESGLCDPPLTTVDQREEAMGYAVLDLLSRRRAGKLVEPAKVIITPKVVLRATHEC